MHTISTFPDLITKWFPLIPRPRPLCRPLSERINEIRDLVSVDTDQPVDARIIALAEAQNKAALLASDCAMSPLARELCWRQFDIFHRTAPLSAAMAKLALQPLVNLGRLHIRDNTPQTAYDIFRNAYDSLTNTTAAVIENRTLELHALPAPTARQDIRRFLWTVLLADGSRALIRLGRWNEAVHHLREHKGIGQRLFDGRQTAILAHIADNNFAAAADMIDTSDTPQPWEQAVSALLDTLNHKHAGHEFTGSLNRAIDIYESLDIGMRYPVFTTRLGILLADLARQTSPRQSTHITRDITRHVLRTEDAYSARDLLTHSSHPTQSARLDQMIRSANLQQDLSKEHLNELHLLMEDSGSRLTRLLIKPGTRTSS